MENNILYKLRKVLSIMPLILLWLIQTSCNSIVSTAPIIAFSTGGHSVYYLQPSIVKNNKHALVAASFDGTILCYSNIGEPIWEIQVNKFFPCDLAVADIDNDGFDEVFVATAGNTVDAIDDDGTLMWTFKSEAPLYQVCPVRTGKNSWLILTGGIEEKLFALSTSGELMKSVEAGDVVRHIRKVVIPGEETEYASVATASSGLNGLLSLMLIEPVNLEKVWYKTKLYPEIKSVKKFMSMTVCDLNKDGNQEIVLSGNPGDHGRLIGFDVQGNKLFSTSDNLVPNRVYQMNLITRVNPKGGLKENILGVFGKYLIIYDEQAKAEACLKSNYDFTSGAYDPETNTFYLGSSASGGDGIYAINLDNDNWQKAFEEITPVGQLAEVMENIALVKRQIAQFQAPEYQSKCSKVNIIGKKNEKEDYTNLTFIKHIMLSENYGDRSALWCRDIDYRRKHNYSSEEIIDSIRSIEAKGENFIVTAGHGSACYISPNTMEKIILVAPEHFCGFLFTEMEHVNDNMKEVVEKIIFPIAEKCSTTGKKIFFDNKNIFWNGSCYVDFWKDILLNPRFSDVFVPNLEETNSRTQELSLAGRMGHWLTGSFDDWAIRVVDDNPCFDRMREWSAQQIISHFFRQLVFQSSLGAKYLSVDIVPWLVEQVYPFYDMVEKGIIIIPKKEELMSISNLCLGMRSPPSNEYLKHGINGHDYNFNEESKPPMVFDRLDCYYGGAPISDHDFSNYGYGCQRRMLNFIPINPYGLVAITPDDTDLQQNPYFEKKVSTDGQYFFDESGQKYGPVEYKETMIKKLEQASKELPVLVKGKVGWSVVRIDSNHARITLVDPGYTDPANRNVEVLFQHLNVVKCTDILSNDQLNIEDGKVNLKVPAGVFRIIDIEYK